jgi:transposase
MKKFKRHRDYGFWDRDIRPSRLSQLVDPLERLNKGIDFEMFRGLLESGPNKLSKGAGGRPPCDYVLMFKIMILQRYYNLSDDQVEYQVSGRMSFMRFSGLTLPDDIPDSRTVWHFREQLSDRGPVEKLFELFLEKLESLHLTVNEGKITDAGFVEAPRQRNRKEENEQIKAGDIPESFTQNPHKPCQKDVDARWTKKNKVSYYG